MDVSWRFRAEERDRELGLVGRVHVLPKLGCGFALLDLALAGEVNGDGVINGGSLMMSRNKVKYLVIEKESSDDIGHVGIRFHIFFAKEMMTER
jgi:hypothetical protein